PALAGAVARVVVVGLAPRGRGRLRPEPFPAAPPPPPRAGRAPAAPHPRRRPGSGVTPRPHAPEGLRPPCLPQRAVSSAPRAARSAPCEGTTPCGGRAAPPVEELAPLFPQMEIIQLIGRGGMGAVYKARQPSLDRLVAVKVLPREAGQDPAFAERFN